MKRIGLLVISLCVMHLPAQENPQSESEQELGVLLDRAIILASRGEWDKAFESLDIASGMKPNSLKLREYRNIITELAELDEAHKSGFQSDGSELKLKNTDETEADNEKNQQGDPPFVIEREYSLLTADQASRRDQFRSLLGLKLLSVDLQSENRFNAVRSVDELFYSYMNLNLSYWFPFFKRSTGLVVNNSGYNFRQPEVQINRLDLGLNIRGFLFETLESRMEIGVDFGAALTTEMDERKDNSRVIKPLIPFIQVWLRDPLLYRVFNNEELQNLIFGTYLKLYLEEEADKIEALSYGFNLSWNFKNLILGTSFDWWDDKSLIEQSLLNSRVLFGFSIFAGYRL